MTAEYQPKEPVDEQKVYVPGTPIEKTYPEEIADAYKDAVRRFQTDGIRGIQLSFVRDPKTGEVMSMEVIDY